MKRQNKNVGSSLNEFLQDEGLLEEARAVAMKEILWARRDTEVSPLRPRRTRTSVEMTEIYGGPSEKQIRFGNDRKKRKSQCVGLSLRSG